MNAGSDELPLGVYVLENVKANLCYVNLTGGELEHIEQE